MDNTPRLTHIPAPAMSKEAQVRYMQHHSSGLQSLGYQFQVQRSYVGEPSTSWNASPTIDV